MKSSPVTSRRRRGGVPAFALFGDSSSAPMDMLHIEAIQSRSSLYQWEIAAHTHQGLHQILWVSKGPALIRLDEVDEECSGPVVVVIPPGVVHAFQFAPQTEGHVLTFNPRAVLEGEVPETAVALRNLFATPRVLNLHESSTAPRRVLTLMNDLAEEFTSPEGVGSPVVLWLARSIVWRLAQSMARAKRGEAVTPRAHAAFTRFVVLVEAHHREHWPVSRYASRLGMSTERLNRLTRAEVQRSALDLVHERLTREACRRLTYVAAPISEIASELGFLDPAYFCRFFQRRTGHTPRDFRKLSNERTGSALSW